MSRETLRTEHGGTVAVAHWGAVEVILRMVALMEAPLALMTGR